ncbi:uncharacterized protein LOC122275944 [Carya illinoinensis]|uniref:DUF7780 domain-containing protein n=1 Tax=Carya illinoinensis TaxID=32201 RepID=A0A8T1PDN9_CARIL|nr:uncharacterized protein LOC122275944 [Carya illinoinensis]KAG6640935.1 hypothetical protein CIPAW_09G038700 [Carya illinoinensis]KAG6694232.1 hypothetical protein I3842_09G038500 [Carya illinoinensis]
MGLSAKSNAKAKNSSSSENWGMGLLLVFFPEDNHDSIVEKNKLFSSSSPPSSSSSSSSSLKSSIRRSSTSNLILSKAQSTISICALFIFITLLLFTLSTFEPTPINRTHPTSPRRFLSQKPPPNYIYNPKPKPKTNNNHNSEPRSSWFWKIFTEKSNNASKTSKTALSPTALQGMGTLYRRGTKAMNDLVVAHVLEDATEDDFRLFSRALHRSGLTARADIVFIFATSSFSSRFGSIVQEENDSFFKLIRHYKKSNSTTSKRVTGFDVTRFTKAGKKEKKAMGGEPIWGKRIRSNFSNSAGEEGEAVSAELSYGSVVGFESSELDPENSLSGFLDKVPMSLRRWACYPMLLGRLRRNFKHVMLADVRNSVVLGDPLSRVRNRSPLTVHLSTKSESSSSRHGKKNSDKTQSHRPVNSAVIMGGTRGVRRLSNAMLTEIVRASMQHKKKNSVSESSILSQLVASEFISKTITFITSPESIPDMSSLAYLNSAPPMSSSDYPVIQRGNSNHDYSSVFRKLICLSEVDSSVYRDC